MSENLAGIQGDIVESLLTLLSDINNYCRDIGNMNEEYAALLTPISLGIAQHTSGITDHVKAILELRQEEI